MVQDDKNNSINNNKGRRYIIARERESHSQHDCFRHAHILGCALRSEQESFTSRLLQRYKGSASLG